MDLGIKDLGIHFSGINETIDIDCGYEGKLTLGLRRGLLCWKPHRADRGLRPSCKWANQSGLLVAISNALILQPR